MMRVIIDCNVWISFLLGYQKELIREIRDVASRPKIQSRISEGDLEQLFRLIKTYCINASIIQQAVVSIRDKKDLYLLSLAKTIDANYIVSGDNDLLVLQEPNIRIVSPAQFKMII